MEALYKVFIYCEAMDVQIVQTSAHACKSSALFGGRFVSFKRPQKTLTSTSWAFHNCRKHTQSWFLGPAAAPVFGSGFVCVRETERPGYWVSRWEQEGWWTGDTAGHGDNVMIEQTGSAGTTKAVSRCHCHEIAAPHQRIQLFYVCAQCFALVIRALY